MAPDSPSLSSRRALPLDPASIPGWGTDADVTNDPTWPMRDRRLDEGKTWPHPPPQQGDTEVLQSIEYSTRPAIHGLGPAPSGLSGVLRRAAFGFSESNWWHWLLLLGADRVNMIEGIGADLVEGHVPNIPAELGMPAQWRHNRPALLLKIGIVAGAAALTIAASRRRSQRRIAAR